MAHKPRSGRTGASLFGLALSALLLAACASFGRPPAATPTAAPDATPPLTDGLPPDVTATPAATHYPRPTPPWPNLWVDNGSGHAIVLRFTNMKGDRFNRVLQNCAYEDLVPGVEGIPGGVQYLTILRARGYRLERLIEATAGDAGLIAGPLPRLHVVWRSDELVPISSYDQWLTVLDGSVTISQTKPEQNRSPRC